MGRQNRGFGNTVGLERSTTEFPKLFLICLSIRLGISQKMRDELRPKKACFQRNETK